MQIAKKTAPSRKRNNKGFSLIELIIVITIMAILTALLAPQLLRYVEQSRAAKDAVTMDEVHRAVQLALTDEKVYGEVTNGQTITYTAATGDITGAGTLLAPELTRTLGRLGGPALVSTKYTATTTQTLTIVKDGTTTTVTYTHP